MPKLGDLRKQRLGLRKPSFEAMEWQERLRLRCRGSSLSDVQLQ
jgi:hypothetical protein